jgi:hypothetical protein
MIKSLNLNFNKLKYQKFFNTKIKNIPLSLFLNSISKYNFTTNIEKSEEIINNNKLEEKEDDFLTNKKSIRIKVEKKMPKKFDPPQIDLKKRLPEKEPETLNYKKFKYNKELAELKTDIDRINNEKPEIKEGYASSYYKLDLKKEFDLLDLRNILYTYLFVRQRNGHIYLNINDFGIKVNI